MKRESIGDICLGYSMFGCVPVLLTDHTPTKLTLLGLQIAALLAGVIILSGRYR